MDTQNEELDAFESAIDATDGADTPDLTLDQGSVEQVSVDQPQKPDDTEPSLEDVLADGINAIEEAQPDTEKAPEKTAEAKEQEGKQPEQEFNFNEAPRTWKKEAKAEFDKLPETIKREIHRREEDIHRGIAQYKTEANEWRSTVEPFMENFRAAGVDEKNAIKHLLSVEHSLRNGDPHTKAAVLANLIQGYHVNMDLLVNPNKIDQNQIQNFQRYENERVQRLNAQQQLDQINLRETDKAIHDFSKDKEFIKDAEPVMVQIISGMSAQDRAGKTHAQILDEAYEAAIWQVPAIRQTLLERQAEQARKQAEESNRRSRAKTAAVGVKNSSVQKASKPVSSNIDDVFAHALQQHGI